MYKFWIAILCLAIAPTVQAQELQVDYSNAEVYEIGGIKVKGNNYSDEQTIISISGLRIGQEIRIPGTETQKALRALWKLNLFTEVEIYLEKKIDNIAFLRIDVYERPRFSGKVLRNIKKSYHEDINGIIERNVQKGTIVTDSKKAILKTSIEKFFVEKGFLDAAVTLTEKADSTKPNAIVLIVEADLHKKVKIKNINFVGVEKVRDKKLRKLMKGTKEKRKLFSSSKFIKSDFKTDKKSILQFYNKHGYRDAAIIRDSIYRDEDSGYLTIDIVIEEGNQYYFRDIKWKGNSIYTEESLARVLGISNGDVYNTELLETRLMFSQDGRDVSSLYMDNGYLFFRVDPIEVAVENDSVDLEMRIFEGPQATIDRVVIQGNDRTHDHVIRRELRTKPGQKFSRADIIRSQRQLLNLNYFNPENMDIQTPVNYERGTVDIEYTVEERPSDQLELSAGYQPSSTFSRGGLIGTIGVTFNNFSIRNILHRETWAPLPQGDGQTLSLRVQLTGDAYQSYNASFTEPWLGGHKANSFTVSTAYTHLTNYQPRGSETYGDIHILNGTVALGTRLRFPDDNFVGSIAATLEQIKLNNYAGYFTNGQGQSIADGKFNNFNATLTLSRVTINEPLFPTQGSRFILVGQFTPPYSAFSNKNYSELPDSERLRWVEYHKYKLTAEWFTSLGGKFVLRTAAKLGYLGYYNKDIGTSPFERFELGGSGINQTFRLAGRDIYALRGYEEGDTDLPANADGASIMNKYTLELRYPISTNPSSTIYLQGFLEAGNVWDSFKNYNPFALYRTAGAGVRVFLPMFGTIGLDYGFGFDKNLAPNSNWLDYAKLSFIFGFEPE